MMRVKGHIKSIEVQVLDGEMDKVEELISNRERERRGNNVSHCVLNL